MHPRWEAERARANDMSRPLFDLVLRGLYRALGQEKDRQVAAARLKDGHVGNMVLPEEGEMDKAIVTLHNQMQELLQRR